MNGRIIYVQTREYTDDRKIVPLPVERWDMCTIEPHYDEELYDKYVMFPITEAN